MAISCTPASLAAAAKCFQCLPSEQKQWIDTYLLALIAGGSTDPNTLAKAAKGFQAIPPGMIKRVQAYLLCQAANGGGGGTCPQDMQVAWTPTNLKLGELTSIVSDPSFGGNPSWPGITTFILKQASFYGFVDIENAVDLTSISGPNLVNITGPSSYFYFAAQTNPVLTSISFPLLVSSGAQNFQVSSNAALTTLNVPSWLPTIGQGTVLTGNAFNAATVNMVLARCKAAPTYGNAGENILLNGGTSAAPTGQGIIDKAALILRGAVVTTN